MKDEDENGLGFNMESIVVIDNTGLPQIGEGVVFCHTLLSHFHSPLSLSHSQLMKNYSLLPAYFILQSRQYTSRGKVH